MSIRIDGRDRRIGLALSGGGFRAAAYHLGVFRKLEELGLLRRIDLLSCVSGGSIAGGFLAAHWERADVLDRLENYLRTRSIAFSSVIGGMLSPFESRLDMLARSYDQDIFNGAALKSLQAGPRVYFNATSLSTGNLFFFVAGGGGKSELGEWEIAVHEAPDFPICKAVAASSAFPPVFPPLRLDHEVYPASELEYLTLADGGIYDNLGVNPLVRQRNQLDYAIVSDAGKPFDIDPAPTEAGSIVLKVSIGILMEQVRGLQFKALELAQARLKTQPIWFSIDTAESIEDAPDAAFASAIGTNLSRLSEMEIRVLGRHSGRQLEARLKRYAPELLAAGPAPIAAVGEPPPV